MAISTSSIGSTSKRMRATWKIESTATTIATSMGDYKRFPTRRSLRIDLKLVMHFHHHVLQSTVPPPTNVDPPTQVGATSNVLPNEKRYFLSSFPNHHFPGLSYRFISHPIGSGSRDPSRSFLPWPPPTPTTQPRTAPATDRSTREYQPAYSIRRRRCSFRAAPRP